MVVSLSDLDRIVANFMASSVTSHLIKQAEQNLEKAEKRRDIQLDINLSSLRSDDERTVKEATDSIKAADLLYAVAVYDLWKAHDANEFFTLYAKERNGEITIDEKRKREKALDTKRADLNKILSK